VSKAKKDNRATKKAMQHKIKPKKSIDKTKNLMSRWIGGLKKKFDCI